MKFEEIINAIINQNCFDLMKIMPDNSIDFIFTDPPYNIADKSKLTKKGNKIVSNWESWGNEFQDKIPEEEYEKFLNNLAIEFKRILKPGGQIVIFFDRGKSYLLKSFYDNFELKNIFVFIKKNPVPHIRKNNYRSGFEQALWFSKGKPNTFNFLEQKEMINVFYGNIGKKDTNHPTEKYRWMVEPIILRHSKEGEIILDPFCGSGSMCLYSKLNNRNYIGIDNKEEFCEMARKRLI